MAQKLRLKVKKPGGADTFINVTIVRSWIDADGRALFLHTNGVYGDKTGAPIKSIHDLDIITNDIQKRLATQWWNMLGKKISAQFYESKEAAMEKLAMESVSDVFTGDNTDLDQTMYIRRPVKTRARSAFSDPFTWSQYFSQRPDWWGSAGVIELGEFRYEMVTEHTENSPPADANDTDDESKGSETAAGADDKDPGDGDSPPDPNL